MPPPYALSCHCGAIRWEVDAELIGLGECNCSTCVRHGFLHWKAPLSSVKLASQSKRVSVYMWRDVTGHNFCPTCGVGLFRTGYPGDRISVNARCLDGVDVFTLDVVRGDGRNTMPPEPFER